MALMSGTRHCSLSNKKKLHDMIPAAKRPPPNRKETMASAFRKRIGSTSQLQEMCVLYCPRKAFAKAPCRTMEDSPDRPNVNAGNQRMQLPDLKAFNNLHQFELSASLVLGKEHPAWREREQSPQLDSLSDWS
jgi:hypothetical protein